MLIKIFDGLGLGQLVIEAQLLGGQAQLLPLRIGGSNVLCQLQTFFNDLLIDQHPVEVSLMVLWMISENFSDFTTLTVLLRNRIYCIGSNSIYTTAFKLPITGEITRIVASSTFYHKNNFYF